MAETHKLPEPIKFKVPGLQKTVTFKTFEDVERWADRELEEWNILEQHKATRHLGSGPNATYSAFYGLKNQAHVATREGVAADQFGKSLNQIQAHIEQIKCGEAPVSGSPIGQAVIDNLKTSDRVGIGLCMLSLLQEHPGINQNQHLYAMNAAAELSLARHGLYGKAKIEGATNQAFRDQWDIEYSSLGDDARNQISEFVESKEKVDQFLSDSEASFKDMDLQHQHAITEYTSELERMRTLLTEDMKTQAPRTYWQSKSIWNLCLSGGAFALFVLLVVIIAALVLSNSSSILDLVKDSEGRIQVAAIVFFTIPALAFFWVLRLISRIFVANLLDWMDSRQRVVMVDTYRALVAEGSDEVSKEERILILQALFRPGPQGSSDDGPPAGFWDFVAKAGDRKQ